MKKCLEKETYEEYISFLDSYQSNIYENKYLSVDINTRVKGYMSGDINEDINEERNTEAKQCISNFIFNYDVNPMQKSTIARIIDRYSSKRFKILSLLIV